MARAKTNPTRIDDTASKASSNWVLIVEELFPQWRDRLGSSKDAKDELDALLYDPETRSAIHKVDASGKEIPGTASYPGNGFWQDRLLLIPDPGGGADHLAVDYPDSIYLPDGDWRGFVSRLSVERWERLYPELAAPPPPPPAAASPAPGKKRTLKKKRRKAKSAPIKARRRGPKAKILPRLTAAIKDDIANQKLSLDELKAMPDKTLEGRYLAKRERIKAALLAVADELKK
jgi:hypothetical protein